MSYSVCLECKEMVYAYEKYCSKCEKTKKPGANDPMFWKTHGGQGYFDEPKRSQELAKDRLEEKKWETWRCKKCGVSHAMNEVRCFHCGLGKGLP